ncbi:hypothetical protein PIB30_008004 [Stylosanthes scabra]|uniref:Uncharacterized protein n=1 Tax=Stylosanthes scabra TaxID=79078 RepID=A0ABU6U6F6_9FABA|nr:hypothetical protein [Stylosanthes scabra]
MSTRDGVACAFWTRLGMGFVSRRMKSVYTLGPEARWPKSSINVAKQVNEVELNVDHGGRKTVTLTVESGWVTTYIPGFLQNSGCDLHRRLRGFCALDKLRFSVVRCEFGIIDLDWDGEIVFGMCLILSRQEHEEGLSESDTELARGRSLSIDRAGMSSSEEEWSTDAESEDADVEEEPDEGNVGGTFNIEGTVGEFKTAEEFVDREGLRRSNHYDWPDRVREERLESRMHCKAGLKIHFDSD